jgi:hypothetical protein
MRWNLHGLQESLDADRVDTGMTWARLAEQAGMPAQRPLLPQTVLDAEAVHTTSGRSCPVSALGRIRTCDTRFRKPMLYPLSYEGLRRVRAPEQA